jgi:hypothetical protein
MGKAKYPFVEARRESRLTTPQLFRESVSEGAGTG